MRKNKKKRKKEKKRKRKKTENSDKRGKCEGQERRIMVVGVKGIRNRCCVGTGVGGVR